MKATITLVDHDGQIACDLTFEGGFKPASPAHQHAQILIKMMDELCTKQQPPEILRLPVVDQAEGVAALERTGA